MTRYKQVVDVSTGEQQVVPFTPEEEAEADAREAAFAAEASNPANFPLNDRQLRLGLVLSGISLATIEAAINGIPDPTQRAVAQIWWDRSLKIEWEHPMRAQLQALVGLTDEQARDMWLMAKDLQA